MRSPTGYVPLPGTLVLSLLMASAAPAVAQDIDRFIVRVTELHVNDCPEVGACSWKLLCGIGEHADSEFIRFTDADTGDRIEVQGDLQGEGALPVTLTCTAMEYDGTFTIFPPVWNVVGTNTLTFSQGHQEMRLDQDRDEGDVTVKLIVEELVSTQSHVTEAPPPPPPDAPTGCRAYGPGQCGSVQILCDAPLPRADWFRVSGGIGGLQPYHLAADIGAVFATYVTEGAYDVALCAGNRGGSRCSPVFAVSLGAPVCANPPSQSRCRDGEVVCRNACRPPEQCQREQ